MFLSPLQLFPDSLLGHTGSHGGAGLHYQLPVVHTLGHGQEVVGPDLKVIELLDGLLSVLLVAVADVAVSPEEKISQT